MSVWVFFHPSLFPSWKPDFTSNGAILLSYPSSAQHQVGHLDQTRENIWVKTITNVGKKQTKKKHVYRYLWSKHYFMVIGSSFSNVPTSHPHFKLEAHSHFKSAEVLCSWRTLLHCVCLLLHLGFSLLNTFQSFNTYFLLYVCSNCFTTMYNYSNLCRWEYLLLHFLMPRVTSTHHTQRSQIKDSVKSVREPMLWCTGMF